MLSGAIIGGGFVSGSELVTFFGEGNYAVKTAWFFVVFTLLLYLAFIMNSNQNGGIYTTLNGRKNYIFIASTVCNFILFISILIAFMDEENLRDPYFAILEVLLLYPFS